MRKSDNSGIKKEESINVNLSDRESEQEDKSKWRTRWFASRFDLLD